MNYVIIAVLCIMLSSFVGSLIGIVFKKTSNKANDAILGFAAGIMLSASFLGLLPNVFAERNISNILIGVIGIVFGAVLVSVFDKAVPNVHNQNIENIDTGISKNKRILFLVFAIAIHNLPEGFATGIALNNGFTSETTLLIISLIIHKLTDGLIVIIPLLAINMKKSKAILFSSVVSLMMLPGLFLGFIFGSLPTLITGLFYGITFGAIIYVIISEIIPDSQAHGHQKSATFGLILGVLLLAVVEILL